MYPNPNDIAKPAQIIQGGAVSIVVRLINRQTNDPFDLTGLTALTCCFQNSDGTELMLSLTSGLSVLTAVLGKIQLSLSAAQTTLLNEVEQATLELTLTFAGDPIKVQIPNAYTVVASGC